MHLSILVSIFIFAITAPAQAKAPQPSSEFRNTVGSAAVGFGIGGLTSAILLIKDATCGVVMRGGPEYHGKQRILPLALLVTLSTMIGGVAGYVNRINLLDAVRPRP